MKKGVCGDIHLCFLQCGLAAMYAMVLRWPSDLSAWITPRAPLTSLHHVIGCPSCTAARQVNSISICNLLQGHGWLVVNACACWILSVMLTRSQSYTSLVITSVPPAGWRSGLTQPLPGLAGVHTLLTCRQGNTQMLSMLSLPCRRARWGWSSPCQAWRRCMVPQGIS